MDAEEELALCTDTFYLWWVEDLRKAKLDPCSEIAVMMRPISYAAWLEAWRQSMERYTSITFNQMREITMSAIADPAGADREQDGRAGT